MAGVMEKIGLQFNKDVLKVANIYTLATPLGNQILFVGEALFYTTY